MTTSIEENRPLLGNEDARREAETPDKDNDHEDQQSTIERAGCGTTALCNPRTSVYKVMVLILMCFLSFGVYFCYDNPSVLQKEIKEAMDVDTSKFMLLYSLYSWPNVILCFFGGFLLDRVFGIRIGAVIFSIVVVIGQCITAVGASINSYTVMLVGRFVLGIGGESLTVAQNTYAAVWFKDKGLNLVFGLQRSISRCGSTLNMNVMKPIFDLTSENLDIHQRLGLALWFGAVMCVFSLFCGIALGFLDFRAVRILNRRDKVAGDKVSLTDVKDFPVTLWLLFLICVAYYAAVIPLIGLAIVFFENKFHLTSKEANAANSLVYFISAATSPLFGALIDRFGYNIFWLLASILLTIISHVLLAFTFYSPFIAMSLVGCSFSIVVCVLWPIVALIMPPNQLGTSYGCMQSIFNLGLAVVSQMSGKLVDTNGYFVLEIFFLVSLCVALMASVLLYLIDASRGGSLNLSTFERQQLKQL